MKHKKLAVAGLVMGLVVMLSVAPLVAQEPVYPIGTITLETTSLAAGVGLSWGDGTLKFKGKEYKFSIKGLSVAAVGISKVNAVGEVYNMENPADFAGNYAAVSAGLSLAQGASGLIMRNNRGVVIALRAAQQGVQLNAGLDGFNITMK